MPRSSNRKNDQLRDIKFETGVALHAEGSCLVKFGNTHVLCTASVDESLPPFLRHQKQKPKRGWVTAEYGLLPRSTHTRCRRESSQGKISGRTSEIQRLIGRSLRSVVNMEQLGERQIIVDCDVLQADGGTRTASICGGYLALKFACDSLVNSGTISHSPITNQIAAISCGINDGDAVLDLDYSEDSVAEVDCNFVMNDEGKLIEIQGTAESKPFDKAQLDTMYDYAWQGIEQIMELQNQAIHNFYNEAA